MFDIIADSACDFTPEMAQKMGVEIVPFYVSLDGEHYRKEGKEIAVRDFYQFMVDNPSAYPKTSLASIEDFEEVFRRQAEAGRPTLCLCFTGKMSGCVGSARNARELVLEDYPDAKIEVEAPDLETVKRGRKDQGPSHIGPHVLDICQKADLVFLGLHGMDGEDGRIQAALDLLGVPYTGAGHLASAVAMDKAVSKQILDACGIPTPKWRLLSYGLDEAEPLAQTLPMPCVIKTIGGGSSLGVYLPEDRTELKRALEEVLRYGAKVLAEERIYGRELTVAVLGDSWLPAVETVPAGKEFDYVAKYQAGAAVETCPADVPPAVMQAAGELALRTHRALGLEVYSRTDMILDKDGNLWVLEANSLPGMTPNSFVPKEAAAVGMSYEQLCEEIVRLSCDVKRRG